MTIKEAILSFPGLSDESGNLIDKVITDRGLTADTGYTVTSKAAVALCAADAYVLMVNSPDFSEGSLSIKHSRAQMKQMAATLYRENGEPENAAKITGGMVNSIGGTRW